VIILKITGAIGTPLTIDTTTQNQVLHLVNIDFSRRIFDEIMVERDGFAFKLKVVYKWILVFFTHYRTIGHDITNCRWLLPKKMAEKVYCGKKNQCTLGNY